MKPNRNPKRVALFVGVDQYPKDRGLHTLTCAVADALAMKDFFDKHAGQYDHLEALENPKFSELRDKIDELTENLSSGDLFLFFFAGHGIDYDGKQQLLCLDSKVKGNVPSGTLELNYVSQPGTRHHTAVILDACRTPIAGRRGTEMRTMQSRDLELMSEWADARSSGAGSRTILCSCDEGQSAGEIASKGHGLFTLALLEVLGKVPESRALEFTDDLSAQIGCAMRRIAQAEGLAGEQRPWWRSSGAPPALLRPTLDTDPLKNWVQRLEDRGQLTGSEAGACRDAIAGILDTGEASLLFETVHFFSTWQATREKAEAGEEFAGRLIRALCKTPRPVPETPPPAPPKTPPPLPPTRPRATPLRPGDLRLLESLDTLISFPRSQVETPETRRRAATLVQRAAAAQTEEDALAALDGLSLFWSARFARDNYQNVGPWAPNVCLSEEGQRLAGVLREKPARSNVESALLRLLEVAHALGDNMRALRSQLREWNGCG